MTTTSKAAGNTEKTDGDDVQTVADQTIPGGQSTDATVEQPKTAEDAAIKAGSEADELLESASKNITRQTVDALDGFVFTNIFDAPANPAIANPEPLAALTPTKGDPAKVVPEGEQLAMADTPPTGFPLLGDAPPPPVADKVELKEKEVGKEVEEKFKIREMSPEESKILQLQTLLTSRLQAVGLKGEENLDQVLLNLRKEMGEFNENAQLVAKEGESFKSPEYGEGTKKALKLYSTWLKQHGVPGSLQEVVAEGLPIPPNKLVQIDMDPKRNRPETLDTFIRKAYERDIKPKIEIDPEVKPSTPAFDKMLGTLNEADNFIIDSAKLMRKAALEFADKKMVEMVKKGPWPKEWLDQRQRTPDNEAWVGGVTKAIDTSMRAGRSIEALYYLQQNHKGKDFLPQALEEAKEFANITYSKDGKKILSVKFDLPKELKLASADDSAIFQKMDKWMKKYGGEVASTLDRVEMAKKDPRYNIHWGDIEFKDGKVTFDKAGNVESIGSGEGAPGQHFNLLSCRFNVKENRNPDTKDVQKIVLDYKLQYGEVPDWAYLNCYMKDVGKVQEPKDGKGLEYEPDDWVSIRTNSGTTELIQAKDLADWKTMQEVKHYGSKALTAAMDLSMFIGGAGTAIGALGKLATVAGKRMLAKGAFECVVGGLGVFNNAAGRESPALHTLETYRGYYFLGHVAYGTAVRPGIRALTGASGPTKFESFVQSTIKDSGALTRGLSQGGQFGFKAVEWPFNVMLVHDMYEQGKLLRNMDKMNFTDDALASTNRNMRDKLLAGEDPKNLNLKKSDANFKSMATDYMSKYADSLGIKDVFKGDQSGLGGNKAEIAKLMKEAEGLLDKPQEERLKFVREKLLPLFQPSGKAIHDRELERAQKEKYDTLEKTRVMVSDTAMHEKDSTDAKTAYNTHKAEFEKFMKSPESRGKSEEIKTRFEKLAELEKDMKDADFRLQRAITKKDNESRDIITKTDGKESAEKRELRKTAAMMALLLSTDKDHNLSSDGILVSRTEPVKGWTVEKIISHGHEGQPVTKPVTLIDRNVTQQLKASDMIELLKEDIAAKDNSVDKRLAMGEFLTRIGGISGEQYAAVLLKGLEDPASTQTQKLDTIARLGTVMTALRSHEKSRGGSMTRTELQAAKGEAMGNSSLDIQNYLHKLSSDPNANKDLRAFASYINYINERNPMVMSADDLKTLSTRIDKATLGVSYDQFIEETKKAAFNLEPKTSEEWDEKYHALVALESFVDDKASGITHDALIKELARCVTPASTRISELALHRLLMPIEGGPSDRSRLQLIDRMDDAEASKLGDKYERVGLKLRYQTLEVLKNPTVSSADASSKANIVTMLAPLTQGESSRTLGDDKAKKQVELLNPFKERAVQLAQLMLTNKIAVRLDLPKEERQLNKDAYDKFPELRVAAAQFLGKSSDDSPATIKLLTASADIKKESDGHVRLEAFRALQSMLSFKQLNDVATDLLSRETTPMVVAELNEFARFFERGYNPDSFTYQSIEEEAKNLESTKKLIPDIQKTNFPDWLLPETICKNLREAKFGVFKRDEPGFFEYVPWAPGQSDALKTEKHNKERDALNTNWAEFSKKFKELITRAETPGNIEDQKVLALILLNQREWKDNVDELKTKGLSSYIIRVDSRVGDEQQMKAAKVFAKLLEKGSGEDRIRVAAIVAAAINSPHCHPEARLELVNALYQNADRSFRSTAEYGKTIEQLNADERLALKLGRLTAVEEGGVTKLYQSINVGSAGTQTLMQMINNPSILQLNDRNSRDFIVNSKIYLKALDYMRKYGDSQMAQHRKVDLCPTLEGKAESKDIANAFINHACRQLVADKRDRVTPIFDAVSANPSETTPESRMKHLEMALAWSGREAAAGSDAIEFSARSAVERIFKACKDLPFKDASDPRLENLRQLTEFATEKSGNRDDRVRLAAASMLQKSPLKADRDLAAGVIAELAVGGGLLGENILHNVRYGVRYDAQRMLNKTPGEQAPAIEKKITEIMGGLSAFKGDDKQNEKRDFALAACNTKLSSILLEQKKPEEARARIEKAFSLYFGRESSDITKMNPREFTNADKKSVTTSEHIFSVADTFDNAAKYLMTTGNKKMADDYQQTRAWYQQGQLDPKRVDVAESLMEAAQSWGETQNKTHAIEVYDKARNAWKNYEGTNDTANSAMCTEKAADLWLAVARENSSFYKPDDCIKKAENRFKESLAIREKLRTTDPIGLADAHINLGKINLARLETKTSTAVEKDLADLATNYKNAIKIAEDAGKSSKAVSYQIELARIYHTMGKPELATKAAQDVSKMVDTLSGAEAASARFSAAKMFNHFGDKERCAEEAGKVVDMYNRKSSTNRGLAMGALALQVNSLIDKGNLYDGGKGPEAPGYYIQATAPLKQLIEMKLQESNGAITPGIKDNITNLLTCSGHQLTKLGADGDLKTIRVVLADTMLLGKLANDANINKSLDTFLQFGANRAFEKLSSDFKESKLHESWEAIQLYVETNRALNKGTLNDQAKSNISEVAGLSADQLKDKLTPLEYEKVLRVINYAARVHAQDGPSSKAEFPKPIEVRTNMFISSTSELATHLSITGRELEARAIAQEGIEFAKKLNPENFEMPDSKLVSLVLNSYNPKTQSAEIRKETEKYLDQLIKREPYVIAQSLRDFTFGANLKTENLEIVADMMLKAITKHADTLPADKKNEFLIRTLPSFAEDLDYRIKAQDKTNASAEPEIVVGTTSDTRKNKTKLELLRDQCDAIVEKPLKDEVVANRESHNLSTLLTLYIRKGDIQKANDVVAASIKQNIAAGNRNISKLQDLQFQLISNGHIKEAIKFTDEVVSLLGKNPDAADRSSISKAYDQLIRNIDSKRREISGETPADEAKRKQLLEHCTKLAKVYIPLIEQQFKDPQNESSGTDLHYSINSMIYALSHDPAMQGSLVNLVEKSAARVEGIKDEQERTSMKHRAAELRNTLVSALVTAGADEKSTHILKLKEIEKRISAIK